MGATERCARARRLIAQRVLLPVVLPVELPVELTVLLPDAS